MTLRRFSVCLHERPDKVEDALWRYILLDRGKPKAALVSLEDYERLQEQEQSKALQQWDEWMAEARRLSTEILARRQSEPIDVAQTKALHFKQLTRDEVRAALDLSDRFDIALVMPDAGLIVAALDWTIRLKRAAAYDSFYVALAQRLGCALWTANRRLSRAVAESWVHCVDDDQSANPL